MRSERIQLTPKQANIYAWGWQPEARYRFAPCGRRFGKTFLASEEMRRAARLAMEWGVKVENEIWYGAPTFKQAKRVFWNTLKRSIPSAWIANKPNETECSITLTTGHIMRVVGLDDPDSLRGSGLWFFLGDEWDDARDEVWPEVIRPMLSTAGGHALFIGSPKGFAKLYNGYIEGRSGTSKNTKSWTYTTIQGGNVPAEEIEDARRTLDGRTFRQEYEASFETFSGQVYYAFSRAQSVKPCAYNPAQRLHIGMDFNINPMSATCWQEVGTEIWQVGEVVIPTANTHDMTEEIIKRYGKPGIEHITIYPDPAGAQRRTSAQGKTDISILREKGFAVNALSSHPLVRDRINAVNSKFQTADGDRHAFVDPSCVKSIECLERQVYKEGTSDPDKSMGFDHLCFAGDVLVDTIGGPVAFEKLPSTGFVRTWNGEYARYVLGGLIKESSPLIRLTFDDGSMVKCTPDHKIFTQRGWVSAVDSVDDFAYNWLSFVGEARCKSLPTDRSAKSLTAFGTIFAGNTFRWAAGDCIEWCGRQLTGLFRPAATSTTLTKTGQITNRETSRCSNLVTTLSFIWQRLIGATSSKSTALLVESWPKNGTLRQMELNGIGNTMPQQSRCFEKRLARSASSAPVSSRVSLKESRLCFAQRPARPRAGAGAVSMMLSAIASSVGRLSRAENTYIAATALNLAPQKRGGKRVVSLSHEANEPVYCLTVPDHGCFALADGTIVKNCDATGYYIYTRFGGHGHMSVSELRL